VAERVDATAGQTLLLLNEGLAVHSVYNQRYAQSGDATDLLTGGRRRIICGGALRIA
jgi:hypothetical protein